MQFYERFYEIKSNARAFYVLLVVYLIETLEDILLFLGRNSYSVVGYAEAECSLAEEVARSDSLPRNINVAFIGCVLKGVAQQVEHYFLETVYIEPHFCVLLGHVVHAEGYAACFGNIVHAVHD